MKSTHCRSPTVTCLISPPRHSSLAVGRCAACSSVRSRTVYRKKFRCLAKVSSRSARSPVRLCSDVLMGSRLPGVGRQTVELSTDSSASDDRRGVPPRRYHQPGDDAGQGHPVLASEPERHEHGRHDVSDDADRAQRVDLVDHSAGARQPRDQRREEHRAAVQHQPKYPMPATTASAADMGTRRAAAARR